MTGVSDTILRVEDLRVGFQAEGGELLHALHGVNFQVKRGQTLGLVGESGSGKTVSALSVMRLLPRPSGVIESGHIWFDNVDIVNLDPVSLHKVRGNRIAMIFQEPMTALNPVHTVGKQLMEVYRIHQPELSHEHMRAKAIDMLERVGIPAPARRLSEYPHQLSGGMRQRVMIAIALACNPEVLIADEPTTALDVTIQAQILDLLRNLQKEMNMAMLFITHDLGVIAELCDEVAVMYGGMIVERAGVEELFETPLHPYTRGLIASIPGSDKPRKSKLTVIKGTVPALNEFPPGCRFQNRCPFAKDICKAEVPRLESASAWHEVRCVRWQEIANG